MIETPNQIFARFERGEIKRDEVHALMALHARELIEEMEEDYRNPVSAWIEGLLARRLVGRLVRRHGGRIVREVLVALGEMQGFPPSKYLWNASHPDVPLHCFVRMRREPVFRLLGIEADRNGIEVTVEHGDSRKGKAKRQTFLLKRDAEYRLRAEI